MKRVVKITLLSILGLIVLVVVALSIALAMLDPNDFKETISRKVEEATGRELVFEGDIKATFFPWLGLRTGKLRLNDAKGFSEGPFLQVGSAGFKLELLPLLRGRINVDEVDLSGLVLKLETDAKGRKNWELMTADSGAGAAPGGRASSRDQGAAGAKESSFKQLSINSLSIKDSEITFTDMQKGASYLLRVDAVEVNGLDAGAGSEAGISARLSARDAASGLEAAVNAKGGLRLGPGLSVDILRLDPLEISLASKERKDLATARLVAEYSMQTRTAEVKDLSGDFAGVSFKGGFTALLPGAKDLAKGLTLDARGNLDVGAVDVPAVQAALAPLTQKTGGGAKAPAGDGAAKPTAESGAPPYAFLAGIRAQCLVTVKEVRTAGATLTDISLPVKADNGLVSVEPYGFKVFDGTASGAVTADLRGKTPAIAVTNAIRGLQLSNLINKGAGKFFVRGVLESNLDVKGRGADWQSLAPTLSGRGDFKVVNGEVRNFVIIPGGIIPGFEGKLPTDFSLDRVDGTVNIANGIADNRDLVVISPLLSANGRGTADLAKSRLDYALDISLPGLPVIPATVSGPFDKLSYSVDTKKLLEAVAKSRLTEGIKEYLPGGANNNNGGSSGKKQLEDLGKGLGKIFK